jgi:hypothetical protein
MVINVIKVVVNIFLPYLGLIVFITITYLYKKGGLLSKILQIKGKKDCCILCWGLSKLG